MGTSGHINWVFCLYLPLAAGVTLCLALLMQSIVATEFEANEVEAKTSSLKFIDNPPICDCSVEAAGYFSLRALYQTLPRPSRLEPDKNCASLVDRPINVIILHSASHLRIFDPERARRLEVLNKKQAEKDKQDKCPLISKA